MISKEYNAGKIEPTSDGLESSRQTMNPYKMNHNRQFRTRHVSIDLRSSSVASNTVCDLNQQYFMMYDAIALTLSLVIIII